MTVGFIDSLFRKHNLLSCTLLAILDLTHAEEEVMGRAKGYPIWEWSARYAKNEGVNLVILTHEEEVYKRCREKGYDVYRPKSEDGVKEVLPYYPCDLFVLLNPRYPLRPRGVLRDMMEVYLERGRPASLSYPGLEGWDAKIFSQTGLLSHYPSHVSLACPGDENETISRLLRGEVEELYNPWYSPETILVAREDKPGLSGEELEAALACEVKVRVGGEGKYPLGLTYDEECFPFPNREVNCTPGNALSLFAQAVAYYHLLFPSAKILYSGLEEARMGQVGRLKGGLLRDWKARGESMFWFNIERDSHFSRLGAKGEREKLTEDTLSQSFPSYGEEVDFSRFDILHISHPSWKDDLVVDKEKLTGKRVSTGDRFFVVEYAPGKSLRIAWEQYGEEIFTRLDGMNVWEKK